MNSDTGVPARLVITGYNLKFIEPFLPHIERDGRFDVHVDAWEKFRVHDRDRTLAAFEDADLIFCEWCGPNAVLASHHRRPDQSLVVRLHRFELEQSEWRDVDIDAVDAVIAVSDGYRSRIIDVTGWPGDKVHVVPNPVDVDGLRRPKQPEARFTVGIVSPATSRKGLGTAVDMIRELRTSDPRFVLRAKGSFPWTDTWVLDRPEEVAYFEQVSSRMWADPTLAAGIVFDPPGRDMDTWLQQVGFVVSTSTDESFHLAPAEGMASGAIPVLLPWPGSDTIYDSEWIVPSPSAMADRIRRLARDEELWGHTGTRAQEQVLQRYNLPDVATAMTTFLWDVHADRTQV